MADLRQRVLPNRLRSNSLIGLVVTKESNHFIILKYCCLFQHFVISCSTYEEPRPIRVALIYGKDYQLSMLQSFCTTTNLLTYTCPSEFWGIYTTMEDLRHGFYRPIRMVITTEQNQFIILRYYCLFQNFVISSSAFTGDYFFFKIEHQFKVSCKNFWESDPTRLN